MGEGARSHGRFHAGVAVLLALVVLAETLAGCSRGTQARDDATPATGDTVPFTVTLDPSLDTAATVESPGGSAPVDNGRATAVTFADPSRVVPLMALDSGDTPVALGFGDTTGDMVLGPRSSALFLVMGLPGMWVNHPALVQLLSLALSELNSYQVLVDELAKRSTEGTSVIDPDIVPLLTAVHDEILTRSEMSFTDSPRGRSRAPLAKGGTGCSNSTFWLAADAEPPEDEPWGALGTGFDALCFDTPESVSKKGMDVPYTQWGIRYTFIMSRDLMTPLAYVPSRAIAGSLSGLASSFLTNVRNNWLKAGFNQAKCAASVLLLRRCEKNPVEEIVDDLIKSLPKATAEAISGKPRRGTFPLVTDRSNGVAVFAVTGWGGRTDEGVTPAAVLNTGSMLLSWIDLARPFIQLLQEIGSTFGSPKGSATEKLVKKCFSVDALLDALATEAATVRFIEHIAKSRSVVELAMAGDPVGALKKMDVTAMFDDVVWQTSKVFRQCTNVDFKGTVNFFGEAVGALGDYRSFFTSMAKAIKGFTKIRLILDAAFSVGALSAKGGLIEAETSVPDCVVGIVAQAGVTSEEVVRAAVGNLCNVPAPSRTATERDVAPAMQKVLEDSARSGPHVLGSGCTPGSDALPDGEYFGWAQLVGSSLSFNLVCLWVGEPPSDVQADNGIQDDSPKLRRLPLADDFVSWRIESAEGYPTEPCTAAEPRSPWSVRNTSGWQSPLCRGTGINEQRLTLVMVRGGVAVEAAEVWTS